MAGEKTSASTQKEAIDKLDAEFTRQKAGFDTAERRNTIFYAGTTILFPLILGGFAIAGYINISALDQRVDDAIARAEKRVSELVDTSTLSDIEVLNGIDETDFLYAGPYLGVKLDGELVTYTLSMTLHIRIRYKDGPIKAEVSSVVVTLDDTLIKTFYGDNSDTIDYGRYKTGITFDFDPKIVTRGNYHGIQFTLSKKSLSCADLDQQMQSLLNLESIGSLKLAPLFLTEVKDKAERLFRVKAKPNLLFAGCSDFAKIRSEPESVPQ